MAMYYATRAAIGLVSLAYNVPYALKGCTLGNNELTPTAKALKLLMRAKKEPNWTVTQLRKRYEENAAMAPTPPIEWTQEVDVSHRGARIRGRWVQRTDGVDDGRVVLFLHGGGLMAGTTKHYGFFLYDLARRIHGRVFALDYTLAPEGRWPTQLDEALNAYLWLTEFHRVPAARIVLCGDSAGGGLAAHLMVALRDNGLKQVLGAALMSPVVDYRMCSATCNDHMDWNDVVVHIQSTRELILKALPPEGQELAPEAMPATSRPLAGLPPTFVICGSDEVFLDDSLQLAERLQAAGVRVSLKVFEGMWHIFPIFVPLCPEATRGLELIAEFTNELAPDGFEGGAAFSTITQTSMRAHW